MSIYTCNQINSMFSQTISKFINDGYYVNPCYMSGSFSNVDCFIDLSKKNDNKNIIRVMLVHGYTKLDSNSYTFFKTLPTLIIRTIKYTNINKQSTLWPDQGEVIAEQTFYEIKQRMCYSSDIEDIYNMYSLQHDRLNSRSFSILDEDYYKQFTQRTINVNKVPNYVKKSILNRINTIRGFAKAKTDCIKEISSFTGTYNSNNKSCKQYLVKYEFNGKSGCLYLK